MGFERFLTKSARYRRFLGDGGERDHLAEYADYYLDKVGIKESDGWGEAGEHEKKSVLYFFPAVSTCRDELGEESVLPRCDKGDTCIIDGRELSVTEAEYCLGGSEALCHIKIGLI